MAACLCAAVVETNGSDVSVPKDCRPMYKFGSEELSRAFPLALEGLHRRIKMIHGDEIKILKNLSYGAESLEVEGPSFFHFCLCSFVAD